MQTNLIFVLDLVISAKSSVLPVQHFENLLSMPHVVSVCNRVARILLESSIFAQKANSLVFTALMQNLHCNIKIYANRQYEGWY